jgi:hypothetical protein
MQGTYAKLGFKHSLNHLSSRYFVTNAVYNVSDIDRIIVQFSIPACSV